MPSPKIIGILGGMGPYATLSFYKKILDLTKAKNDWDHFHTVIDMNTKVPSRSRHHLYGEGSPVPAMIQSCIKLEEYPVDVIVVPCNSASYYIPSIQPSVKIPIINIMEVAVEELIKIFPDFKNVAVLGGVITYENKTYEPYLNKYGIRYIHHSSQFQKKIVQLIEEIKLNEPTNITNKNFKALLSEIQENYQIDAVILGCTEFGCLTNTELTIPIVDSSSALAGYLVSSCHD
jgi:aspartate racemase